MCESARYLFEQLLTVIQVLSTAGVGFIGVFMFVKARRVVMIKSFAQTCTLTAADWHRKIYSSGDRQVFKTEDMR